MARNKRAVAASIVLALSSLVTFYTFYNLPFILLSSGGESGAPRWLAFLSAGVGAGGANAAGSGLDPQADGRRHAEIIAAVTKAQEAANTTWLKRIKATRGKESKPGEPALPARCMASIDCRRACRKACRASHDPPCPSGKACKRGKESRLEQHATVRCTRTHTDL